MTHLDERVPETLTILPDPSLFRAARWAQTLCLAVAGIAIAVGLSPLFGSGSSATAVQTARAGLPILLTALVCAIGLALSAPDRAGTQLFYAGRAARILAVFGAAVIIFWTHAISVFGNPMHAVAPPAKLAFGFVLLSIAVLLVDDANWLINRAVDVMVCGLCLLAVLMLSGVLYGWLGVFGTSAGHQAPGSLLVCLIALTAALTLRQAEHGVLSIFLGVGMGSKMARIFAPLLLLLTFAWEILNARVGGQFGAALLAAVGVAVGIGILLFLAWRISRMENEIHDLILRDEATRLYNDRGFHLLAEHALRLAKRTNVPFSVLFVEMENLAEIHAELGANAAAASLAEAGEILRATFRESDIKGRIGAADFAVAGRFDRAGISVAALRLEAGTAARMSKTQGPVPLKLSIGHVTTIDSTLQESLKDLLARAGQAKNRVGLQMGEMMVN
jgi:diguanylate cyclase (GGDEF)-like protein